MLVALVGRTPVRGRGGGPMNLLAVGVSFRSAAVALRERLAFDASGTPPLAELAARYGCEAAILSTCNRVELYLASRPAATVPDPDLLAEFLAEFTASTRRRSGRTCTRTPDADAVRHLFRVAASLDSLVVGEGQIAGQVQGRRSRPPRRRARPGPLLQRAVPARPRSAKRVPDRDRHRRGARLGVQRRRRLRPAGVRPLRRQDGAGHRRRQDGPADAQAPAGAATRARSW